MKYHPQRNLDLSSYPDNGNLNRGFIKQQTIDLWTAGQLEQHVSAIHKAWIQ